MRSLHISRIAPWRLFCLLLCLVAFAFAAQATALAEVDSCVYEEEGSGCFETDPDPPPPPAPNFADSMFITADIHDYSHPCWTEYCHGTPIFRGWGAPTDSTACHNKCEYCCLYKFTIRNLRRIARIDSISLCTDRGCTDRPNVTLKKCDTSLGWDHICEYCPNATTLHKGFGPMPATWNEDKKCPRIFPNYGDTLLGDGWKDSLCRSNCLRVHAASPGDRPGFGDSVQFKLGFTGDCIARDRPTDGGGTWKGKCVWVCIKWDDGTETCCQIRIRHCACTNDPTCICPEKACEGSVGPGAAPAPEAPPADNELSQEDEDGKEIGTLIKPSTPVGKTSGGSHR